MKVKICGLTSSYQVETCVKYGADFCGFILNYPKSHRYISFKKAKELTSLKKNNTKFVGVLVNANLKDLNYFSKLNLDYFQLYGDYDIKDLKKVNNDLKKKIIIALKIKEHKDIFNYKKYQEVADIILWDSIGLEKSISWNFDWIKSVPNNITKMIAGNINLKILENVSKLADIVDVSGALETNKVKDIKKIKQFLDKIKDINEKN